MMYENYSIIKFQLNPHASQYTTLLLRVYCSHNYKENIFIL